MTLRLRCLRCGSLAEMDPLDPYGHGICCSCFSKMLAALGDGSLAGVGRMVRFQERYLKGSENHPTFKALSAALDALEAVPPGTLQEVET